MPQPVCAPVSQKQGSLNSYRITINMQLSKYMALVSRYKLPLMGVCIFTVVFAHSGILIFGPASYVKLGVWCMDVFFFLSGMGAHFSLSKNNDSVQFLKRRFNRIYILIRNSIFTADTLKHLFL